MTKLTRIELAQQTKTLSGHIDDSRWALAELAAIARADGIQDYAEIIGVICRRKSSTVSHWARTWEYWDVMGNKDHLEWFPYSFYETAARYEDKLDRADILNLMAEFHAEAGATLEEFRAQLATLAGKDDADLCKHLTKTREKILGWVDEMPTLKGGEYLKTAADVLADAIGEVKYEEVPA